MFLDNRNYLRYLPLFSHWTGHFYQIQQHELESGFQDSEQIPGLVLYGVHGADIYSLLFTRQLLFQIVQSRGGFYQMIQSDV